MARAGFLNDNEYRQYPIIPNASLALPDSLIADCGFIMGLDSDYTPGKDVVYLASVSRMGDALQIEFRTTAEGAKNTPLVFTRVTAAEEWADERVAAPPAKNLCATEPLWEGFLVSGTVSEMFSKLAPGETATFGTAAVVEPARVQTLKSGYLRSINIGNYSRITADACGGPQLTSVPTVIPNATCLSGSIKFRAGYNCRISQQQYGNTITISAEKDADNAGADYSELCRNGGEIALYADEPKPLLVAGGDAFSKFLSGGPACDQTITSINGLPGPAVKIVGGAGMRVIPDPDDPHGLLIVPADNVVTTQC